MSEFKNIHILGYSGHAYVAIDVALANNFLIKGYFDKIEARNNPYNLVYNGFETDVDIKSIIESDFVFPAIGFNGTRKKVLEFIETNNFNQTQLIAPSASVSSLSQIGKSTLIAPKAIVNSMAIIGTGCIINSGSIIEHESKVSDCSHIAPGAVLAGNVVVGTHTFIGANAVIKEGVTIGDHVVVGAGAVVLNNIPSNETWVGNPARRIR